MSFSKSREKVAVTGATGFLGKHVVTRLLEEGAEVTGLGRNEAAGLALASSGARFLRADLSQPDALERAFAGQDFVIHCAALSTPWGRYEDFLEANVQGTANVLAAARKAGVRRFVHVSTPSLYVDRFSRTDIRESDALPPRPINDYTRTKLMAEKLVDDAAASGLPAVTIRPQGIIGPGDTAIIPRLIRVARRGILPIIGDGENRIDLTYVDNVAESLVLAMRAPAHVLGRKYNISNGEPVALYEALEGIFSALGFRFRKRHLSFPKAWFMASAMEFTCRRIMTGKEPILTRYGVCLLALSRTLNIDPARRDLGYEPRIRMPEAIRRVIEDCRTRGLAAEGPRP